ncbi:putative NAD/FAD-binding protein [Rhodococcus sp. PvR044]|uniref:NAD(P)/FAD-dependent oxidoreductase n=1 Tax=Rhodococcus sp. PvR044 TaxID=3156402 RepID=UPI00339308DF
MQNLPAGRNVAVIGGGVAGLTAAHVLSRRDRVTLYEADDRLGGHAHTHTVHLGTGQSVSLDTGFIVHNDRTYPTLLRLFSELGVDTQESDMSMSIRSDINGLEYAGARGLRGLFPTVGSLRRTRHWLMLAEVTRFHRSARSVLGLPVDGPDADETLADFLARHRFSRYFLDHFVTPLVAAVWSCDPALAASYPARYLFTFLDHHGMLTVFGSVPWRTVTGGSSNYVEKVASRIDEVLTGTAVTRIDRRDGVCVIDATGEVRYFDAAVVAVHPHQALAMLGDRASTLEKSVLGAMPYSTNHAQLHTDQSVLPRAPRARASWNYLIPDGGAGPHGVIVTYDLTRLMRIDAVTDRRFLVTLGGSHLVDPASVIAEMTYEHPIYTPESVAAQSRLADLGSETLAFAGAYHGWGFHEDGALSGLRAAERVGGVWDTVAAAEVRQAAR